MTQSHDIVTRLLHDHEQVKKMFAAFDGAPESRIDEMFWKLTGELVRHEVAEEEVVYPEVRRVVPNGKRLADARIKEQSEAEELLVDLEGLESDTAQFKKGLSKLRQAVLAHAEKEEHLIFEPLAEHLDAERRRKLGDLYEKAKAAAPTHPHPHVPDTPPGNLVLGPVAAMFDRARDAIHTIAS